MRLWEEGCRQDNILVERLWRSLKCEEVFSQAYSSVSTAIAGIGRYFNSRRPHSGLSGRTPDDACAFPTPLPAAGRPSPAVLLTPAVRLYGEAWPHNGLDPLRDFPHERVTCIRE